MRIGVVVNPVHRAGEEALTRLVAEAQAGAGAGEPAGWGEPLVARTTIAAPGGAQARELIAAGATRIVTIGGDGTVRHVAAGIAGVAGFTGIAGVAGFPGADGVGSGHDEDPGAAPAPVPLAVVPTGTANLLARNLGIRPGRRGRDAAIAAALHSARLRVLDLGLAHLVVHSPAGPTQVRDAFLVVAGIGHDAAVVAATDVEGKRRASWAAYFRSGAAHLLQAPLPMRVRFDGAAPEDLRTWTVLCGNLGRIPGRIPVFPDARGDDGLLEVLTVPRAGVRSWSAAGVAGLAGAVGWRLGTSALRYRRAATVEVVPAVAMSVQLDGDVVHGVTRMRVSLRQGALRVVVPDAAARGGRTPAAEPRPRPRPVPPPRRPTT